MSTCGRWADVRRTTSCATTFGLLVTWIAPASVWAQTAPESNPEAPAPQTPQGDAEATPPGPQYNQNLDQAARLTFESGREAFSRGDYEEALDRFEQAYRLSARPVLLYNVAVTLDRLRRDEEALQRFREYLEAAPPDAPDRHQVESRVRVLERAVEARNQAEANSTEPPVVAEPTMEPIDESDAPAASEPEDEAGGLPPWVVLAVGGAAVVAAGVTIWSGLDTVSQNDDYESFATGPDATFEEARARYDDVTSAQGRTNALIGVTAGLGATAVALAFFTDWGGGEEPPATGLGQKDVRPSVVLSPERFELAASGRF